MKNIKHLFIAFIAIISLNACSEDDDFTFTAVPDPEGISFTNSTSESYILRASNADNLAERFVWNEVDFDVPTPVNYELIGSPTETFESITVLGNVTQTNIPVTVGSMLELAGEAGLDNDPDTENPNTGALFFKVRAYVGGDGGNVVEKTSEVLTLSVILPEGETEGPLFKEFFMVGDATAAGWVNNNNNTPLFRDSENENIYYFTGRFKGGADVEGFKLLETLGEWQPQWGLDGESFVSSEVLGGDPAAFKVLEDKYYTLTVNREDLTYSFEAYDASADATYGSIGIIGDSTPGGWDADTDMTQSEFDPHIWYIQDIELGNGEMKFRVDNDWAVSWGTGVPVSGQALDGVNIPVSAGTYTIWFNDITKRYIFIPTVTE